ncbi:MAG TPA: 3-oxoacid CoA-transferase subunit A [Candidatus Saccharimonadales bacterium]|nr:3-oxoacid CoA-transferase subunit A [Candidatus Saccharimonadales bacterium]
MTDVIDKRWPSAAAAVADVPDDATVLVGGFGGSGFPHALRDALIARRPKRITIVCNNADFGGFVYADGLVRIVCSYPVGATAKPVLEAIEDGRVQLGLTPQGTLAERLRAGGSGLGGVLTPTGLGTQFEDDLPVIEVEGRRWLLATPLRGDVALIRATTGDPYGNLVSRHASRNFNPLMAMAADLTIAQVRDVVEVGDIDPQHVHIPGAFVDRVVQAD